MSVPNPVAAPALPRPRITHIHLTLHIPISFSMELVTRAVNGLAAVLMADVKGRFAKDGHAHFDLIPQDSNHPGLRHPSTSSGHAQATPSTGGESNHMRQCP